MTYSNEPDLRTGVVPVTKAAGRLARLITQAGATRSPVVLTRKGVPAAALLSVAHYTALVRGACGATEAER